MPKNSKDELPRRAPLDDFVRWTRQSAALKAALELEVFTRIAEGNRSLPALLRATGLNERGTRLLLDALTSINLLTKSAFEYSLSPLADAYLVKGKSSYYGDALVAELAWEPRGQMARSVRSGKPLAPLLAEGQPRLPWARAARTWVDWEGAARDFEPVWDQFEETVPDKKGLRLLGLGAESGVRILPLVRRDSQTQAVIADGGQALGPLRTVLEPLALQDQFELIEADPLDVTLSPASFDAALVDSITPYRGIEHNIGILHRALDSLRMGGRILLRAPVVDDDRKGPGRLPLLGLDLLIGSGEGDVYTQTEYRGMLEAAGFFEVKPVPDRSELMTARHVPPPPPPPPSATVAPDFIPPPETRP